MAAEIFNPKNIIGLTIKQAIVYLNSHDVLFRIASEDGEDYMMTAEFRPDRYNLIVVKNKITDYSVG